ncbi:MAG: hypothetical protein IPM51_11900 [Sphingobacteriaceae bacterium]|nr:hypothetical protein [Sphingobacteriaceae bacterium]
MSLRKLLRLNRWSIQINDYAVRDDDGSLLRDEGWKTIYKNIFGHIQATVTTSAKGKDDTTKAFGKIELESYYTIFHNYDDIVFKTNMRILTHHNPTKLITFLPNGEVDFEIHKRDEIRVFEFLGSREAVGDRRNNLKHFELYLKQVFRQHV